MIAQFDDLERVREQSARRGSDGHLARLGKSLQSRRQVRSVADHRLLLCRTLANQIADHDQAVAIPTRAERP